MKGDIIVLEKRHIIVGKTIVTNLLDAIMRSREIYIITVAGESGSGKSETGKAICDELASYHIRSVLLGQDDYFVLPPKSNDEKRRKDDEWLGPHVEVRMDLLEEHIKQALGGVPVIEKPLIDYERNVIGQELVSLEGVRVLVVEGTYTSLLKNVDARVFIARNHHDTMAHRQKRNRGNEIGDPFVENILKTEHKIIAGHKHLADFIISKDFETVQVQS